jgi:2-haloacid dehalogenase
MLFADRRWVTFDCFGTLVDWNSGFSGLLRQFAGPLTPELVKAYHRFERLVEFEAPHRLYKDVLVTSLRRGADEIGLTITDSQAHTLVDAWGTLPVFEDVEPMLARLRRMGWKLAVLTNCDEDLFQQTQRSFKEPFDMVVTAETVRDYKPSCSHFRFFSRSSGAENGDWVHVACSWYHDIAPARDLGIDRVWLDRDDTGEDPATASIRIVSASEVSEALGGLLAAGRRPDVDPKSRRDHRSPA